MGVAMKKALIDPNTIVNNITGWTLNVQTKKYDPVFAEIPNSDRIAEVTNADFPVSYPLFWVDCADDVVADQWYYNNQTQQIFIIPPAPPYPSQTETPVVGAQEL